MNYYYYDVVKGRHSNWLIAKKDVECLSPGGQRAKERERGRQTHFELSGTTATTTHLQVSKAFVS
jgi:hypothetical protein